VGAVGLGFNPNPKGGTWDLSTMSMWVLQKSTMSPTWIYESATCVDEEEDRGEDIWKAARGTIFRVNRDTTVAS